MDCAAPTNSGASHTVPASATGPIITEIHRAHKVCQYQFHIWNEAEKALKAQLIAGVDDCFISTLKDNILGYGSVTDLALLSHFFTTYGTASGLELDLNDTLDATSPD